MNSKLKNILAEVFGLKESDINAELTKDEVGSWDSLKQMDLVVTLEREYSIALEISDIVKMLSVKSIIEVLLDKGVELES
jgi:acyl carrier protein